MNAEMDISKKQWRSTGGMTFFKFKVVFTKGQKIFEKKHVVLDSSKKQTLGQSYALKITPAFIFWKNLGRHNLLLRFTDL